jgi:hypothetical protein
MACLGEDTLYNAQALADTVKESTLVLDTTLSTGSALAQLNTDKIPLILSLPDVPDVLGGVSDISFPEEPEDIVVGPVPLPSIPAEPEFTAVLPVQETIPVPDLFSDSVPNEPELTNVPGVTKPVLEVPDVPTLDVLGVPDTPVLNMPEFAAAIGLAPIVPDVSLSWGESAYSSTVLSVLESKLLLFINGAASALSPEVEDAIWNKSRDENLNKLIRIIETTGDTVAAKGYELGSGEYFAELHEAFGESVVALNKESAELMVEQVRLEQSNFAFTLSSAVQEQVALMNEHSQVQERSLDAAITAAVARVDVFNSEVEIFKTDVRIISLKAEAFKEQVRARLAEIDAYKATIDSLIVKNQLSKNTVDLYVAELDSIKAAVDSFTSELEAAKAVASQNVNLVQLQTSKIKGVAATLKAKKAEIDGFSETINSEIIKFDAYADVVDAYSTRVEAFKSLVDSNVAVQVSEFNQKQKVPLEVYKEKVDVFKSKVDAERVRIDALQKKQVQNLRLVSEVVNIQQDTSIKSSQFGAFCDQIGIAKAGAAVAEKDARDRIQVSRDQIDAAHTRAGLQVTSMANVAAIASNTKNFSENMSVTASRTKRKANNRSTNTSCSKIGNANSTSTIENVNITEGSGPGFFVDGPGSGTGSC